MMKLSELNHLAKSVDRLLTLDDRYGAAIDAVQDELEALNRHVARLEAREDIVVTEARGAAGAAATMMIGDIARRAGMLEATRLPPAQLGA